MRKSVLFVAVGALVGAFLAVPVAVFAAHHFGDVPTSHTFHDDITWLADTGVTRGCNPPDNDRYCPDDDVTRGQMAAFMRRLAESQVVDAATAVTADQATSSETATSADSATTAEQSSNSDTLDGMDSSDFLHAGTIVTATGGPAWVELPIEGVDVAHSGAGITITGNGAAAMPLTAPAVVGETEYRLESFELCYDVSNGAFITEIRVTKTDDSGGLGTIFSHFTDYPTSGCTAFQVGSSAGRGMSIEVRVDGDGVTFLKAVLATWQS